MKYSRKNKHPDIVLEPKVKVSDIPNQPVLPRNQIRLKDPTEKEIQMKESHKKPENYDYPLSKYLLMKPKL